MAQLEETDNPAGREHRFRRTTAAASSLNDLATADDRLGFTPYVTAIRQFLLNPNTTSPLTISIEGEWGSGKSSFMLQLENQLHSEGKPTVLFNAWRHEKAPELWAAFALEFVKQLSKQCGRLRRTRAVVVLRMRRMNWTSASLALAKALLGLAVLAYLAVLVYRALETGPQSSSVLEKLTSLTDNGEIKFEAVLGAGGTLGLALSVIYLIRKANDALGNPIALDLQKYLDTPAYGRHSAFIEEFHRDFRWMVEAYTGEKTVYVFIDDLDRAEVPRAAELVQALNLMISDDRANVVFVLGMDREKVAAGIASKYKDLLPFCFPDQIGEETGTVEKYGVVFGHDFVEKFVQLPFRLPRPTEREVRQMLGTAEQPQPSSDSLDERGRQLLEVVEGNDSEEITNLVLLLAPALDYNPRRIKQFVNMFRLKLHIASQTGLFRTPVAGSHRELTLGRLAKFVAIGLRWPLFLSELSTEPDLFDRLLKPGEVDPSSRVARWRGNREFMKLLHVGGVFVADQDGRLELEDVPPEYDMRKLDVDALLQTSPVLSQAVERILTESLREEGFGDESSARATKMQPPEAPTDLKVS